MNALLILTGWPWIAIFIGVGVCLAIRERDKQIPVDSPAAQPEAVEHQKVIP